PAQFSPFHRPWQETESQSSPQTVINTSHRPSQPLVHSESLPTPLPYSSIIRQSLQLADTVAAPVTSVPSFDKGDYSSFPTTKQTVGYRDHSVLPSHLDRNAESSQREHVLVEFLGKMLSELQVMRDHIQTELPARREVTQSVQPPNDHDPMPAGYPDESVRPTSHRLALPPAAYSNYPHDPSWYPTQRFEPVRAAHLPHPHESFERRRPGYLMPMHRTSTLHPDDRESTYRSPAPSIPDFITGDPSEFTRLKIALENLLPPGFLRMISDCRRRLEQKMDRGRAGNTAGRSVTILHGSDEGSAKPPSGPAPISLSSSGVLKAQAKAFCPYCEKNDHYLSQCPTFKSFNKQQITDWIQTNHRCWRCVRAHQGAKCTLKKPCSLCKGRHLQILHEVNSKPTTESSCLVSSAIEILYLDRPTGCRNVLLKVVRVLLRHGDKTLDTYAVLDDGSERTILLSPAATKLGIHGPEESLALHTGCTNCVWSRMTQPQKIFRISAAFTAERLCLADHSYPLSILEKYQHLRNLPLQSFEGVRPVLLIGADNTHLITPISPVRLGPSGGPAAIQTRLGWTLQGPVRFLKDQLATQHVFFLSLTPSELHIWQIDVLPYRCEKQATRSKEDREAISLLEAETTRVEVNGIFRYATPLLRRKDFPFFCAPKEAVMSSLRGMERQLARSPEKLYGAAIKLLNEGQGGTRENWYIPHHMITHNGKTHLVFNCSFEYEGLNLNDSLLPGPVLSPSLLGVLLRFREHCVAISGDIRGMFHQVLLLPEDRPLLRFLWRDLRREDPPDTYEWQVLPYGTTCSPSCATFALQRHVALHSTPDEDVRFSVDKCFYVDNCLQSLPSVRGARQLVDKSRPATQQMVDLPPPRLRLFKPAFYSTGMDCFGPFIVKLGRRTEKSPHRIADLCGKRFIGRRGQPAELYSDQGTNFRGLDTELREAFCKLSPDLQQLLAKQRISFHFNPPASPHFEGMWEREIRSIKASLRTTLGSETVSEEVLLTVLIEVEAVLNSKPLGYVAADLTDPDAVTPNCLLMGQPDGSLPQVVFPESELLTKRRWRHSQVLADRFWTAFIVRTVEIRIKDKTYIRPIARLIALPEIPEENEHHESRDRPQKT
ncbi:hypothetical protein M9458_018145, partial [Cirrhinus mrigala]